MRKHYRVGFDNKTLPVDNTCMFHSHLLPTVRKIASIVIDAGEKILSVYNAQDWEAEQKQDGSPLTLADREAHRILQEGLTAIPSRESLRLVQGEGGKEYGASEVPDVLPVLSEEGSAIPYGERKNWPFFWLVDPLDGTKEFLKKNGEFTVNLALIRGSSPCAGFVYVPVKRTLYIGISENGAFRYGPVTNHETKAYENNTNEDLVKTIFDTCVPLPSWTGTGQPLRVVASRSHRSTETEEYIQHLRGQYGPVEVVTSGSSLKLCRIAEGSADVYPRFGPTMEWDTAAAHAVCSAAGAYVVDVEGKKPLVYNKEDIHNPFFLAAREEEMKFFLPSTQKDSQQGKKKHGLEQD